MQNTEYSVGFVDSTTIQIRLELGTIDFASYTTDIPDNIHHVNESDGYAFDIDGNLIGRLRGKDNQFFVPLDTYNPSAIEDVFDWVDVGGVRSAPADNLSAWSVTVDGQPVTVTGISRKANILETANTGWQLDYTTLQNVFLELDQPLDPGAEIVINFNGTGFEAITATYDPVATISEAIHVNLAGFDPDDAVKTAYLSSWNGFDYDPDHERGGEGVPQSFAPGLTYSVIDEGTGQTVLTGQTTLAQAVGQGSNFWQNYALTDVWQMDLSDLTEAGDYHVVVEGVGRSQSFEIADDHWDDIFDLVFKGYYHQRSGIALEEEYTDWTRPRALHPDDGITIRQTTVQIIDTSEAYDGSLPKPFEFWEGNLTGETVDDAWGGWHDAGDFDRRTQHMQTTRKLIELHEFQTDWSEGYDGNIPESGDGIPDLLNEAIWGTEVFRRLQHDDGGVPGGIESASYGGYGDSSFTDQRDLYVYAPDVWTSWEYAATAAKIARALEPYDADEAAAWLASGVAAFDWAEARVPPAAEYDNGFLPTARNLAAAELFETTGETRFKDLFAQTFAYAGDDAVEWYENQYDAAWLYATSGQAGADAALKTLALSIIEDRAEWLLENGTNSGFGFVHDPYSPYGWGATASQPTYSADFLVRMHALTGDQAYLDAITQDVDYALGANPLNMSFITGLDQIVPGARQPEEVLHADMDVLGIDPPPGITLYGEHNVLDYGWGGWHSEMWEETWPNYYDAPVHESWNGAYGFVPVTEFTVMQGMEDMTFVAGYLAALAAADSGPRLIEGTPDADTLDGTGSDETVMALSGDDMVDAGGGADFVDLGEGNDTGYGGDGTDTLSFATLAGPGFVVDGQEFGISVSLAGQGTAQDTGQGSDTFDGFENLEGSGYGDILTGDDAANVLTGLGGSDVLDGGGGDDELLGGEGFDVVEGGQGADSLFGGTGGHSIEGDIVSYFSATGPLVFDFGTRVSEIDPRSSAEILEDIIGDDIEGVAGASDHSNTFLAEDLTGMTLFLGGSQADTFQGGSGVDQLIGLGGGDVMYGNDGGDALVGDAGDDDFYGGSGADVFFFDGVDGNDTIHDLELDADLIYFTGGNLVRSVVTFEDADADGNGVTDTLMTYDVGGVVSSITIIDHDAATVETQATTVFG
ncbi:MAG: glycoside hydrolase family 9 protein [Pseudomonadota bacterium]